MSLQQSPFDNVIRVQWASGDFAVGANDPASLTDSNGFLRYIRTDGSVRWSVRPGIGNIGTIKVGQDGSMVCGGSPRSSSPTPGFVFPCVALAKVNSSGGIVWTRFNVPTTPGVDIPDHPASAQVVATDINSNSFVVLTNAFTGATFGSKLAKLSPTNSTIWIVPIQGSGVSADDAIAIANGACDSNGNLWAIVRTISRSTNVVYLMEFSAASGAVIYQEEIVEISVPVTELGMVLTVDRDDNIIFGTPTSVHKRTLGGSPIWSASIVRPFSMGADAGGNIYVTRFVDPLAASSGVLIKLASEDGASLWSQFLTDQQMRLAVNSSGQSLAAITVFLQSHKSDGEQLWTGGDAFFIACVESWSKRFSVAA